MESILHDPQAQYASPELNVAAKLSVREYEALTPYVKAIEKYWGPAPGHLNTDGQNLLIYGKHFGNVFIGVQPTFGYEGDPMRLLFPGRPVPTTALPPTTPTWKRFGKPTWSSILAPTGLSSSCRASRLACPASATRIT